MKPLFLTIALFIQLTVLPTFGSAAETCESCQRRARSVCALRCDKTKNRLEFDTCSKACVERSCEERCVARTSESTPDEKESESCADCVYRHELNECYLECDINSPHAGRCRKACAQKKCAKKCVMPDPGESKNTPQKQKYACENCKVIAESQCALSTACPADEPGTVACQFKCAQDRCADECLTD